jgi:SpoVK/Ycf46/Vps4 family AAA+-type ATPase
MWRAMQKKTGARIESAEADKLFLDRGGSLSGADIEAVLVRARMNSAMKNAVQMDVEDLKAALEDFIPPSYPTQIELQNLVAVLECTSKSLLPEKYRVADRGELTRRAAELTALEGDR